jgi:succinoglycan biosynthesis transport protein ExoP
MPPIQYNKPKILPSGNAPMLTYTSAPAHHAEAEELLSMHHYLWLLRRAWMKIAIAVFACTALTIVGCYLITPVFEGTTLITVDNKVPSSVLGTEANAESTSDVEQFLNTEMDLIQSDEVLRPVAEKFHLLPDAKNGATTLPSGPVSLKNLSVTHPANSLLLKITYQSKNPQLAANVANAVAHSYIDQVYETRVRSSMDVSGFMEKQLDDLKLAMNQSASALAAYERQLGAHSAAEQRLHGRGERQDSEAVRLQRRDRRRHGGA